jgi:ATPase subunit of ABC transporter with duplicated ATPase domains
MMTIPALWLQQYLDELDTTLVIVSHDRAFLNAVAKDIIYFNKKKLKYHPGNFESFQQRKEEKLREQQRVRANVTSTDQSDRVMKKMKRSRNRSKNP